MSLPMDVENYTHKHGRICIGCRTKFYSFAVIDTTRKLCPACVERPIDKPIDNPVPEYVTERVDAKTKLVIHLCCTTCGLPGDITKPVVIAGETFTCCRYHHKHPMDGTTRIEEGKVNESKLETNDYGQFVAPGVTGQFCSPFCLMQGMFTYGRCAGCSKSLPRNKNFATWMDRKKEWIFDRYIHCSPECRKKYAAFTKPNVLTAEHLAVVLGTEVLAEAQASSETLEILAAIPVVDETGYKGRCANKTCGSGRDRKGNRVRGRVPKIGDVCSKDCRKVVREAARQNQAAA